MSRVRKGGRGGYGNKGGKKKKKVDNVKETEGPNTNQNNQNVLGVVTHVDPSSSVPQLSVIKVLASISVPDFVALSAVWPLFAVKNSVPNDLVTVGVSSIGSIYAMYLGITYDLYLATQGTQSVFTMMPRKYKELRDALMPKTRGGTSFAWTQYPSCFGTGGLVNILYPEVGFASLSWPFVTMPTDPNDFTEMTYLYDFVNNGVLTFNDNDVYNECPTIIQNIWNNLAKRFPLDLIYNTDKSGFESNVGCFSQPIDLSYEANLGWVASIIEEQVPNSQYWTRFLGLVPFSSDINTRTGIHVENDYKGPHHYASHLMAYNCFEGKEYKTILRYKSISLEEIMTFVLTQLVEADLYNIGQETSTTPSGEPVTGFPDTVFNSITQSQFLRYILIVALTRFTQEGWTGWNFKTCVQQTVLTAGVNLTPYADTFNIAIPTSLSEYLGSLSVLKSMKGGNGKGGWLFVTIPLLSVYGNTSSNVYTNGTYPGDGDISFFRFLGDLVSQINPGATAPDYNFLLEAFPVPPNQPIPGFLNVIPDPSNDTHDTVNLSQVQGTGVVECLQQVSSAFNMLKGFLAISVAIANKDMVPFTILYFTRFIDMVEQSAENFSLIATTNFLTMTNRVYFDQRTLGNYLGVPMPITCAPQEVYQVIFNEHTIVDVTNVTPFFNQTIRTALQFVHPKESTNNTSDWTLLNYSNTVQQKGGNIIEDLIGLL